MQAQRPCSSVISGIPSASSVIHLPALQSQCMWLVRQENRDLARSRQTRGWSAFADHDGGESETCGLQPESRGSPEHDENGSSLSDLTSTCFAYILKGDYALDKSGT